MALQHLRPSKTYPTLGKCIYCGCTSNLTDEHIIPLGLGGRLIFEKASCGDCSKATCKVEDFVLRRYLCALRSFLSLPSRNPRQRPTSYKLTLWKDGRKWDQNVSLDKHPGVINFAMLPDPPGAVRGLSTPPPTYSIKLIRAELFRDAAQRLRRLDADSAEDSTTLNAMMLVRMLAKIAHGFTIAELGPDALEDTRITHLVRGEAPDWSLWIGGCDRGRNVECETLHELKFLRRGDELSVILHLFAPYCPRYAYEVIVGRLRAGVLIAPELEETTPP